MAMVLNQIIKHFKNGCASKYTFHFKMFSVVIAAMNSKLVRFLNRQGLQTERNPMDPSDKVLKAFHAIINVIK